MIEICTISCCYTQSQQTTASKALRVTFIATGAIAIIAGVLLLRGLNVFGPSSLLIGKIAVSAGILMTIIACAIKRIRIPRPNQEEKQIPQEPIPIDVQVYDSPPVLFIEQFPLIVQPHLRESPFVECKEKNDVIAYMKSSGHRFVSYKKDGPEFCMQICCDCPEQPSFFVRIAKNAQGTWQLFPDLDGKNILTHDFIWKDKEDTHLFGCVEQNKLHPDDRQCLNWILINTLNRKPVQISRYKDDQFIGHWTLSFIKQPARK